MTPKPLKIPDGFAPSGFWTLVSPAEKIHHALRAQLLERDSEAIRAWTGGPGEDIAHHLRSMAAEEVPWPNAYFIPSDPWALVGWDESDQLTEFELCQVAEEYIGRRLGRGFWKALPDDATFGDVVSALDEARRLELGRPLRPRRSLREFLAAVVGRTKT